MPPRQSPDEPLNVASASGIFVHQSHRRQPARLIRTQGEHRGLIKFRQIAARALSVIGSVTPLCSHIGHVVALRAKKYMARVAAARVVAFVASLKAVGRTDATFVGNLVGIMPSSRVAKLPISKVGFACEPRPALAFAANLNSRPTSAFQRAIGVVRPLACKAVSAPLAGELCLSLRHSLSLAASAARINNKTFGPAQGCGA